MSPKRKRGSRRFNPRLRFGLKKGKGPLAACRYGTFRYEPRAGGLVASIALNRPLTV